MPQFILILLSRGGEPVRHRAIMSGIKHNEIKPNKYTKGRTLK